MLILANFFLHRVLIISGYYVIVEKKMINRVQSVNNNNYKQNFKGLRVSDGCLELLASAKLAHKKDTSGITPPQFKEISEKTQDLFHSDDIRRFRRILRRIVDMNTDLYLKVQRVVGDKTRFSLEIKQNEGATKKVHLATISKADSSDEKAIKADQFLAKFEQSVNDAYARENGITTGIKKYFSPDY